MKLTTVTNVSLDGVTQGHREIDVATRGGFERFGWGPALLDEEASSFIGRAFQRADAFLFGRRTYEILAGAWGAGMDPGNPGRRGVERAAQSRGRRPGEAPLRRHRPPDIGLELVDLQSTPRGLVIQTYRTLGRPQYET